MTYEIDYNDTTDADMDLETLAKDMLGSFKDSLGTHWIEARPVIEEQVTEVRRMIVYIREVEATGEITKEDAQELIEFQMLNMQMLQLEALALSEIAIETAINAAFKTVREAVNRLVNFELL